jgi:hypothetical protein
MIKKYNYINILNETDGRQIANPSRPRHSRAASQSPYKRQISDPARPHD